MLRLAFPIWLQISRRLVNLIDIISLDLSCLDQICDSVHQTASDALVESTLFSEFVEHQTEMRPLECLYELGSRLLQVRIKGALAFEAQLGEAVVVLANVFGIHGFELRLKLHLESSQ